MREEVWIILTRSDKIIIIVGIILSLSIFLYGYSITLNDNYLSSEQKNLITNSKNYSYFKNNVVVTPLDEDILINGGKIYLCICPDIKINISDRL